MNNECKDTAELDYANRRWFTSIEIANWLGISHVRVLEIILKHIGYGEESAKFFRLTNSHAPYGDSRPLFSVEFGGLVLLAADLKYRSRRNGSRRRKVNEFCNWFASEYSRLRKELGETGNSPWFMDLCQKAAALESDKGSPVKEQLALVVPFVKKSEPPGGAG